MTQLSLRLLEYNPIPSHPWLTVEHVREELAIQDAHDDIEAEFLASVAEAAGELLDGIPLPRKYTHDDFLAALVQLRKESGYGCYVFPY